MFKITDIVMIKSYTNEKVHCRKTKFQDIGLIIDIKKAYEQTVYTILCKGELYTTIPEFISKIQL